MIGTRARSDVPGGAPTGDEVATQPPPLAARILPGWHGHRDLLDNAGSLLATTGLTALLGFVYWAVATRMFSQQAIGYGSAAVSAFTLLGTIGMFGFGTLLIGELPQRSTTRAGLVSAALIACSLGSLVLGIGFVVVAPHVSSHFSVVIGTPARAALFVAGSVVTAVTLVFDQATIGLLRGRLQLGRNITFAAAKLAVLPAAAIVLRDELGFGVTAAWVAGMALSLVATAAWLRFKGTNVLPRPHWGILRELGWTAMAHNWLNIAINVPITLLPVLVTILVSPSANGAYYVALMLAGFLYAVPIHLSTVLFAVVAGDPTVAAKKLRFALRLSFMIGLPGMIFLIAGAHLLLSLFGPGYAHDGTVVLVLLAIGYPTTIPIALYIAVCRASGNITRAAVVLTTFSAIDLGMAAAGAVYGGLIGMQLMLLAGRFIEALLLTPTVLRAAMGQGRHRRAAHGVPAVVPDAPGTLAGRNGSRLPAQMRPQDRQIADYPRDGNGSVSMPPPRGPAPAGRNGSMSMPPRGPAPVGRNGSVSMPPPRGPAPAGRNGSMSMPARGPAPVGRNGSRPPAQMRPQDRQAQDYARDGNGSTSTPPPRGPDPRPRRAPANWPPTGPQVGRRESA
jgi:O-antigen/teichoic acid export membrane protein